MNEYNVSEIQFILVVKYFKLLTELCFFLYICLI